MLGTLHTLPAFAAYFAATVALLVIFLTLYALATPHRELALIRAGNAAAAAALIGAALGYVLPLASVVLHAVSILDLAIWGGIALLVQLAAFFVVKLWLLPDLSTHITAGSVAHGVTVGGVSLAIGVLNAACMVYDAPG